ncbi:MAG: hypothetical protein HOF94_02075 [Alphaproteobacteria bacterium]|jgi:hypothetical protein|nr:hypothetical protein [Alphaproteobacteria bacterium]
MDQTFSTTDSNGQQRTLNLRGRNAWALLELAHAGENGCTPIDHPGPRWSAYVHNLRHVYGLNIETIHEAHTGPFPGNHARYILKSGVAIVADTPNAA